MYHDYTTQFWPNGIFLKIILIVNDTEKIEEVAKGAAEAGKLKSVGSGVWESTEGLIYGQGSREGNRVLHVLDHTVPNPNKPSHTIFSVDKNKVIGLVDEAWKLRGTATVNRGNDVYDISMGKVVGTNGEIKIRIVTKRDTNEILSAYPRR